MGQSHSVEDITFTNNMSTTEPADLELVIRRWAEIMLSQDKTNKKQTKIPRQALECNINWKKLHFIDSSPQFSDDLQPRKVKSHVVFRSSFNNNTTSHQENSFQTSKTTLSKCDVTVSQCYTIGGEMNTKLKTPEVVMEANAGYHTKLHLKKTAGQTIEEEACWKVDSKIKVPSDKCVTAELVISEYELSTDFSITTQISGRVIVVVTNREDNNSLVKTIEGNIAEIIRGMAERDNGLRLFKVNGNIVEFVTKGSCKFHYGAEQHVNLEQEDSDDIDSSILWQ